MPSISCNQASRTLGSLPSGSIWFRRVASSADRRSHLAKERWRGSVDKAASAVQNVTGAFLFFLFVAIEKKRNKD